MRELMSRVLEAERACEDEIARAERDCQERVRSLRERCSRELDRLRQQAEQAGRQRFGEALEAAGSSGRAALAGLAGSAQALRQDGQLCAALQQRIIEMLLG
jgi:vacuolar-type H+-ATPase subunit H